MAVDDDRSVADEDEALRWNRSTHHQLVWDDNQKRLRVSSGSLIFNEDELSVYLDSLLQDLGLGADDILQECGGDSVWAVIVSDVRQLEMGVAKDPADDGLSVDPAHALLLMDSTLPGNRKRRLVSKLAKLMRCVAQA